MLFPGELAYKQSCGKRKDEIENDRQKLVRIERLQRKKRQYVDDDLIGDVIIPHLVLQRRQTALLNLRPPRVQERNKIAALKILAGKADQESAERCGYRKKHRQVLLYEIEKSAFDLCHGTALPT